ERVLRMLASSVPLHGRVEPLILCSYELTLDATPRLGEDGHEAATDGECQAGHRPGDVFGQNGGREYSRRKRYHDAKDEEQPGTEGARAVRRRQWHRYGGLGRVEFPRSFLTVTVQPSGFDLFPFPCGEAVPKGTDQDIVEMAPQLLLALLVEGTELRADPRPFRPFDRVRSFIPHEVIEQPSDHQRRPTPAVLGLVAHVLQGVL